MSVQARSWAKSLKTGSPSSKAVLLAVADYADEHGECWPSQLRLAEDTELSERAVRDALRYLQARGFLVRERRRRSDGYRAADRITLTMGEPHRQELPVSPTLPAGGADLTGTTRQTYRQEASTLPAGAAGPTTFEPSKNHQEESERVREPARDPDFVVEHEAFWFAYPNQVGKPASLEAFIEARRSGVPLDVLVEGARHYWHTKPPDRQWLNPATFLRQHRWLDKPAPAVLSVVNGASHANNGRPGVSPYRGSAAAEARQQLEADFMRQDDGEGMHPSIAGRLQILGRG
jgi:biotin operon repressor